MLLDSGFEVTVIDSLITGNKNLVPKKAELIVTDIDDEKIVEKVILKGKFNLVMHFAGLIRVDESVKEPQKYNEYNFEKAKKFLNICFKNKLNKVIFSSTASIYGDPQKEKVDENDLANPLNPYATSKLKLENFIIEKSKKTNINYVILRYFNVAGADEKLRSGLISKFSTHLIKRACEVVVGKRSKLVINGNDYDTADGTPVRDFIHVTDLADIHLISAKYLIHNGKSEIFNCGYGKGYSVKEIVESFNQILDKKINFEIGPRRDGDSKMIIADSQKFKKYFSWKPKFNDIKYIIKTAIDWEKKIK
tara:strand:+ start:7 stop:927 length:921 start_codon:yes stop_codon:yes gene_type:complete